jgi:hypothetical protein
MIFIDERDIGRQKYAGRNSQADQTLQENLKMPGAKDYMMK